MLSREYNKNLADKLTPTQVETYRLHCEGKSSREIAAARGCNRSSASRCILLIEKKAVAMGVIEAYDPEDGIAAGMSLKKASYCYNRDGEQIIKWTSVEKDKQRVLEEIEEFASHIRDIVTPRKGKIAPPKSCDNDIMAEYPIADAHIGMYAWAEECGENYDANIAKKRICDCFDSLVLSTKPAASAIITIPGDLFHADNETKMTSRAGNSLDVDGRHGRVFIVARDTIIYCIDKCLMKHKEVDILCVPGNHDDQTSYYLSIVLYEHYLNEPRVTVRTEYRRTHYKEFGKNLIGVNHGMLKPPKLLEMIVCDMPEAWGRTTHHYMHIGHLHNSMLGEAGGMKIEGFRSIKSKDAYETDNGYRAGRDMCSILFHKDYGEIERHTCSLAMIGE